MRKHLKRAKGSEGTSQASDLRASQEKADQPGQRLRLECAGKIKKSARMPKEGMEGGRELVEE